MQLADTTNVLVFVIRHGQTVLNKEKKFRGPANPPLDSVGIQQAKTIANLMEHIELSQIFCSEKQRALKTAEIIAAKDGLRLPIHQTTNLRALDVGDYAGQPKTPEAEKEVAGYADTPEVPFPGGESINDFRRRIQPCLMEACEIAMHCGKPVLIVAHSSIVHEVGNWIYGKHKCILVEPGGMAAIYLKDGKLAADAIYKPITDQQINRATTIS